MLYDKPSFMAKLTKSDVLHVAKLSKLDLTSPEVEKFQSQLSEVLNYMDELNTLDTDRVLPTSQSTGLENVFRGDDHTNDCLARDIATTNASRSDSSYFVTKGVLKK